MQYIFSLISVGLSVWLFIIGWIIRNSLKLLQIQQNKIIRICQDKKSLDGFTNQNYKDFKVLPMRSIYKKFVII